MASVLLTWSGGVISSDSICHKFAHTGQWVQNPHLTSILKFPLTIWRDLGMSKKHRNKWWHLTVLWAITILRASEVLNPTEWTQDHSVRDLGLLGRHYNSYSHEAVTHIIWYTLVYSHSFRTPYIGSPPLWLQCFQCSPHQHSVHEILACFLQN